MTVVLLICLVIGGILLIWLMSKLQPLSAKAGAFDRSFVKRKWQEIEVASRGTGGQLKQAVIEADKLLDYVLKGLRYSGQDMAHRLGAAGADLTDPDSVWAAHKLRNRLAHDTDFDLVGNMAAKAIASIRVALTDLGVFK